LSSTIVENAPPRPWYGRVSLRRVQFALDVAVLAGAFAVAYLLRFDFSVPPEERTAALTQLPLVVIVQFLALRAAGVQAFIWRYIGLSEVRAFAVAAVLSAVPIVIARMGLPSTLSVLRVPLSVILMDTFFAFSGVLGLRLLRRIFYERYERKQSASVGGSLRRRPTLLIGAGHAGVIAARELMGRADMGLDVYGFVDDDREKRGAVIYGIKVLGTVDDLPRIARELGIEEVVITIAAVTRAQLDRIMRACESVPVKARIIPGIGDLLEGKVEVTRLRDVQIEDLLGREQVVLDEDGLRGFMTGKVVMVTGAGGSIGSELCRQVMAFAPSKLLLVERAEPALFAIDMELRQRHPGVAGLIPLLADVGDEERMRAIFVEHRPQVVVHAAAHKHVPLMEQNPFETLKNNVFGTRTVGRLAGTHGVEVFVLVSTDKAVRPASMMGTSKRVAELVVQDLDRRYDTRYVAVRFGNVLGSNGSVIPIFRDQIAKGGPVTVTHPDMKRYFMTIPEASQLVLQAGAMGEGGEIFVLDMGEPVRIVDLAARMIALSGLRVGEDIELVFSGVRPGEKLFEELETEGEHIEKTRHPKIFIGRIAGPPPSALQAALDEVVAANREQDVVRMRRALQELLPEADLGVSRRSPSEPELVRTPHPTAVIAHG
jgi:FlaA1/EpsC-like NDP-sugar epimerase